MAFTLVDKNKKIDLIYKIDPSYEEAKKYVDDKLSPIKSGNGYFFVNMKDQYMQDRLKSALGVPHYEVFHETTGRHNWILYNPTQYNLEFNREDKYILRFNHHKYDGSPLEMPINASSLCSLFSWMQLPDNLTFSKDWDTKDIVDMSMMFAGTVFSDNFDLSKFSFESLLISRYMFFGCTFKRKDFFKSFDAPYIVDAECMFATAAFGDGIDLNLSMTATERADRLFFDAQFSDNINFGNNFNLNRQASMEEMFMNASKNGVDLTGLSVDEVIGLFQ